MGNWTLIQWLCEGSKVATVSETYHCRWGDVDAGDRAWANVIGQMAEHDAVHQRRTKVFRKDDLQSALDALSKQCKQLCVSKKDWIAVSYSERKQNQTSWWYRPKQTSINSLRWLKIRICPKTVALMGSSSKMQLMNVWVFSFALQIAQLWVTVNLNASHSVWQNTKQSGRLV